MPNKNITGKNLDNAITSEDVLGKKVIDAAGRFIGVSEKVLIDPNDLTLLGISIDKGALYKSVVVGKSYVERVTPDAIFLKIPLAFEIKGMTVFDKEGKNIGVVKEIALYEMRNTIKTLYVKTSLFSDLLEIKSEDIDLIGTNVILKVSQKEIIKNKEK